MKVKVKVNGGEIKMAQKLGIGSITGSGLVGVLFVAGIGMWLLNIPFGGVAIFLALFIGLVYAALGAVGIGKRLDLIG